MTIDPEKLLQLARQRQHDGGVTLSWPTVVKIVEELRQLQSRAAYLEQVEEHTRSCRHHGRDFEACLEATGEAPCETLTLIEQEEQ